MSIKSEEFTIQVDQNIKTNRDHTKFFLNFLKDGKRVRKILDYSKMEWDKRTRTLKAKAVLIELKEKIDNSGTNFNENSTLNQVRDIYFENVSKTPEWKSELLTSYRLYIENQIGNKKIKDIRKVHIDKIRTLMETKGHNKQTENGCSYRTIKKALLQTLRPILQYCVDNRVLSTIPIIELSRNKPARKKRVTDARRKLATLNHVIHTLYKDNPFYKSLFLFALHGRRWNEICTLEWSDIDFTSNQYTIRAENNKIGEDQTYELYQYLNLSLCEMQDNHTGLVFKSPITGKELYTPKKQLEKIRMLSGIEQLTMHYFRHILVSAMGEIGVSATIMSASLGHTNLQTVTDYYLTVNHTRGSQQANEALDMIISQAEIVDTND